MKKKLFAKLAACLLAGCLALGLVACGGGNETPVVYNVTVQADNGATYGAVNEWHVLSYRLDNCDEATVYVMKDGKATTDYEYDSETLKIRFTAAGNYTVVVGAVNGDKTSAASTNVIVKESQGQPSNPTSPDPSNPTDPDPSDPTQPSGIVLGTDPFGGTHTELVPDIGMLLYYDATYNGSQVAASNVTYSVESGSATIAKVNGDDNYRYLLATKAGTVKVKMTVSVSGEETKTAEKTFTVTATTNWQSYGNSVYGGLGINFDNNTATDADGTAATLGRQTMVITKQGLITNRNNAESLDGILGLIYCGGLSGSYEVTFDVTAIKNGSAYNSIILTLWTGTVNGSTITDGESGNVFVNWKNNDTIGGGFDADKFGSNTETRGGTVTNGTTFSVRLKRTVSGSNVTLAVEYSTDKSSYKTIASITKASSTASGNAGSPITNIIVHHYDGGVFEISNIQKTQK